MDKLGVIEFLMYGMSPWKIFIFVVVFVMGVMNGSTIVHELGHVGALKITKLLLKNQFPEKLQWRIQIKGYWNGFTESNLHSFLLEKKMYKFIRFNALCGYILEPVSYWLVAFICLYTVQFTESGNISTNTWNPIHNYMMWIVIILPIFKIFLIALSILYIKTEWKLRLFRKILKEPFSDVEIFINPESFGKFLGQSVH